MKKNSIIGCFIFLGALQLRAQDSLFNKFGSLLTSEKSSGDHVSRAVESGIYLIRSSFLIKSTKTGQEFGKAKFKNRYFGYQFYVAMNSKNKLWIPPSVSEPWLLDSAYKEYGDSIRPVFKDAYIQLLNDTASQKMDMQKVSEHQGFKRMEAPDTTKSLHLPPNLPSTACWLVSYYADENDKFTSTTTSITPIWDKNNRATVEKPFLAPKGKLVGGIVLKEIITFGKIEFQFVGLYFYDGTRWLIQAPMTTNQLSEAIGPAINDADLKDALKNKNKKNKKEDAPKPKKEESPKPKKEEPNKSNTPKSADNKGDK